MFGRIGVDPEIMPSEVDFPLILDNGNRTVDLERGCMETATLRHHFQIRALDAFLTAK